MGCFAGGLSGELLGTIIFIAGVVAWNPSTVVIGSILCGISAPVTIAGIVMWPIGQARMNRISRAYPNGFTLFENEKVQLNIAANGLRLNF